MHLSAKISRLRSVAFILRNNSLYLLSDYLESSCYNGVKCSIGKVMHDAEIRIAETNCLTSMDLIYLADKKRATAPLVRHMWFGS